MSLDPENWAEFRAIAHRMLDASIDKLQRADEGRVWTPVPQDQRSAIEGKLPVAPTSAEAIQTQLAGLLPFGVGNTHPRFFGWVHGAGTPSGLLADIAAAGMNVNAGGRNHIAPVIEREVIKWSAEMMGMGPETSGLIVSGTSMATIIALKVARDSADVGQGRAFVGYTSEQTHSCVERAFDLLGLQKMHLRKIACNDAFEIDLDALRTQIQNDRTNGFTPFVIIGTAGAVNMGAIDDLNALADLAARENLWLHVDGAFGATANLSKNVSPRLTGLARADSLAFDFHKWLQVNYDAGCVLIQNEEAHRAAFSDRPAYLRSAQRGLAGGEFWAVDHGPELSRGFRALKVWAHLKHHGTRALAAVIDRNIKQAQLLETLIHAEPNLEMLAPVPLNICCFRYGFADRTSNDRLNNEIVVQIQEQGIAVVSTTTIRGELAIRANLTNHRTRESDLVLLVQHIVRIGDALASDASKK